MAIPWPRPDQRAVFIGPTESGKTALARVLLWHYRNVLVVDCKRRFTWKLDHPRYLRIATSLPELSGMMRENEATLDGAPIIYRPPEEHLLPSNSAQLDEVARYALASGGWLLYYDDLVYVARGAAFAERSPHWFFAVTTGREKSVGVWSCVQRPTRIPLAALSESDFRFVFYLRQESDRDRAESLAGTVPWDELKRKHHSFVYSTDILTSPPMRLKGIS